MYSKIFASCACLLVSIYLQAQTEFLYPLKDNFQALQTAAPDLVQIPNNDGLTGEFVSRNVPETTCGQAGTAGGYFFEDDAGFQFDNPEGFIDQAYSLSFNFQVDEFISPPQWVRILSFTHVDDVGVYIKLTGAPDYGTLEFWPYGTVGEQNFFSPNDFYQLILVRDSDGMIKIYVNGQEFAQYDDGISQKYVPQAPDNFIVFFRDHPSVLADEASPGFVSSLRITNRSWTANEVQAIWEEFCSTLLAIEEPVTPFASLSPNPCNTVLRVSLVTQKSTEKWDMEIHDVFGRECPGLSISPGELSPILNKGEFVIDVSSLSPGIYVLVVREGQRIKGKAKFVVAR